MAIIIPMLWHGMHDNFVIVEVSSGKSLLKEYICPNMIGIYNMNVVNIGIGHTLGPSSYSRAYLGFSLTFSLSNEFFRTGEPLFDVTKS